VLQVIGVTVYLSIQKQHIFTKIILKLANHRINYLKDKNNDYLQIQTANYLKKHETCEKSPNLARHAKKVSHHSLNQEYLYIM
jgi:hypothetical protein